MDDFPAAHSMDTHWFAVDAQGRVGLFFTGETGFMPQGASQVEADRLIELWEAIAGTPPPGVEDGYVDGWDEFVEAFVGRGFYYYNYVESFDAPEGVLEPYTLWGVPEGPLHVGQLPPRWQALCGGCVLGPARFGADEHLQPLDFSADEPFAWSPDVCAYFSADEAAVRPIRGREEQYRAFCEEHADQLRADRPGLRFEGL